MLSEKNKILPKADEFKRLHQLNFHLNHVGRLCIMKKDIQGVVVQNNYET